jgi:hypothetical protein
VHLAELLASRLAAGEPPADRRNGQSG